MASKMLSPARLNVIILRYHNQLFKSGQGIRSLEHVYGPPKEPPDYNLKNYTVFGNERIDPFFYSDRPSGTGYTDFTHTDPGKFFNRKYFYPPWREDAPKWKMLLYVLVFVSAIVATIEAEIFEDELNALQDWWAINVQDIDPVIR